MSEKLAEMSRCVHYPIDCQAELLVHTLIGRRRTEPFQSDNDALFAYPPVPGLRRGRFHGDARHTRGEHAALVALRLLAEVFEAGH